MKFSGHGTRFETPCFGLPASFSQNAHLKSGAYSTSLRLRALITYSLTPTTPKPAGELPNNDSGMNEAA